MPARDARALQTTVVPVVQLVQLHAWLAESHAESSSEVVGDSPNKTPNCSPDIVTDPSPVRPMFQRSAKLTIGAACRAHKHEIRLAAHTGWDGAAAVPSKLNESEVPTTPATVIASRTRLDFNLRALHATVVADVQLEVVHVASSESSSDAVGVRFHGPKWRPAIVTVIMEPAPLRGTFGACSPLTAGAAVESTIA
jgi:hypothetical protein